MNINDGKCWGHGLHTKVVLFQLCKIKTINATQWSNVISDVKTKKNSKQSNGIFSLRSMSPDPWVSVITLRSITRWNRNRPHCWGRAGPAGCSWRSRCWQTSRWRPASTPCCHIRSSSELEIHNNIMTDWLSDNDNVHFNHPCFVFGMRGSVL